MSEARTDDADLTDFPADPAPERKAPPAERHDAGLIRGPRVMLAVISIFALLAITCVIAGVLAWRDIRATGAVVDARQSRLAGSLVFEAILTAESAQRGYLLMRDPAYLANYDAAKAKFATSLVGLKSSEDTPRTALTTEVARVGVEKFTELDHTIALGKAGQFDDAIAIVQAGGGRKTMEQLRGAVEDLNDETDDEVARTTATERQLSTLLAGAIVVALTCVTGLAVLLLSDARRHFGLLETRETSARQQAEALEQRVTQRTRELAEANQRFDAALRASGVTVMTQDRNLVYTWISQGMSGQTAEAIVGRAQQDVMPDAGPAAVSLKRGVIETGDPARGDIRVAYGGSESWYDLTVHPLMDEHGIITGIIAGAIDITRYKEQEARIRLLMRELTHRSKNLLSVIQAIMRQTASNSTSIEDFETRFTARLQSLAGSHDLLVREDWQGASMRELVRSQLGHYIDRADSRIALTGEPLQVGPDAAQHIGMAMHELATNAAKYGALSVPEGKVLISWLVSPAPDGTPMCHLSWEEIGGPPVERPSRRGFGRVVIERTVARALNGDVQIDYAAAGLRWTLEFPQRVPTEA